MEVDEGVVTFGELVDLIGELALAPLVNVVDLASALSDRGVDALHHRETGLGVECRVNKIQQFISLHCVTSSGHKAPGREGAPGAGKDGGQYRCSCLHTQENPQVRPHDFHTCLISLVYPSYRQDLTGMLCSMSAHPHGDLPCS